MLSGHYTPNRWPEIIEELDALALGPHVLEAAFDRIAQELEAGEVVCLFPEGKLTADGNMNVFHTGIERIARRVFAASGCG